MKFNFLIIDLPLNEERYRSSFSFIEISFHWMKLPTALLHFEIKEKWNEEEKKWKIKFYWEILFSNIWLNKIKELHIWPTSGRGPR